MGAQLLSLILDHTGELTLRRAEWDRVFALLDAPASGVLPLACADACRDAAHAGLLRAHFAGASRCARCCRCRVWQAYAQRKG